MGATLWRDGGFRVTLFFQANHMKLWEQSSGMLQRGASCNALLYAEALFPLSRVVGQALLHSFLRLLRLDIALKELRWLA